METLFTAEQMRDMGIKRASDHADSQIEDWSNTAYEFFIQFARANKTFTTEDARIAAESNGLLTPPDKRAWGAVAVKAIKTGLIIRNGYSTKKSRNCHKGLCSVWKYVNS
jgi:hypothetical protein